MRHPAHFALIHSPLVGAGSWRDVANLLRDRGHEVVVPSLSPAFDDGPPYHARLVRRAAASVARSAADRPIIVVGHSAAGALLPAIAEAVIAPALVVFADAVLPRAGKSWWDCASEERRRFLRTMVRGDRLLPWHEWFSAEGIAGHLPDPAARAAFALETPRVPLAFFEEPAPAAQLDGARCVYWRWSQAYDETAREAELRGWKILHDNLDHLAMVSCAPRVASGLEEIFTKNAAWAPAQP